MAAKRGGGRIKTVVYLDVLLLTNFLTAYLLLLAAGALSGQRAPFARMLAGSALAALSALILFAPEQPVPRAGRVQGRHGAGHHGGSVRLAE